MRTLTRHEKKLTLFLVAAVAAGLHLVLLKLALEVSRGQRRELSQIREELAEARGWIGQKDVWTPRAGWLEKNLRPVPAENPAPALQKAAQAAANAAGLKIEEQNLRSARPGKTTVLYANRMRLSGSLDQFRQWLVDIYRPEQGIAVTALSLKMGAESAKMIGEAEVGQFFRANNP